MSGPAYERILLKLSGEALSGEAGIGFDFDVVDRFCDEVAEVHAAGVQVAMVVGGGNIFRGAKATDARIERATGDYMGMLATMINALALMSILESKGAPTRVITAIEMRPIAEPYIRRKAIRHMEKGRIIIFGAGTGNPFFTTDSAAALRASEMNAEVLMKATKVDGVYDKDPIQHADAKRYDELTYSRTLSENLKVMDAAAVSLCRENQVPILVFNLNEPGSIMRAVRGEPIGTLVRGE